MSDGRRAWSWCHAFCQSDLPSTTKHVLHTLHMFMNNVGESCFPSVEEIVTYSGLSKRSVIEHLKAARDAGWIESKQHGYRGRKWRRQEYVPRWPERDLTASCPPDDITEEVHSRGAAAAPRRQKKVVQELQRGGAAAAPEVVQEGNRVIENNPVTNPDTNPIERAGASEREQLEDAGPAVARRTKQQAERLYWKMVKDWPQLKGMPKDRALKSFLRLSEADQDIAVERRDGWIALLRSQGKSHVPGPMAYCQGKLWREVEAGSSSADTAKPIEAKPFGRLWNAARFADLMLEPYGNIPAISQIEEKLIENGTCSREQLLQDKRAEHGWPRVNRMHERAISRHAGVQADVALEPLAQTFGKVHRGSDVWVAWKELHAERGWPWFGEDRDCHEWVWMPDALEVHDSPKEAVRAAIARFETEHATLTRKDAAE